jgi:putative nucleotidyltransferase with HDIG domain
VSGAGVAALAASLPQIQLGLIDPAMLVLLVALAAAAQRMPVFLFRSSAISISFAAVIASFVLYGTGVGVLVALAQALVNAFTPRRKPLVKAAFNTGSLVTSAYLGGTAYRIVGGQVPPGDIALTLGAVAAAALVYFLVNTGLTASVIAISERQSLLAVWRTNYSWMPLNFLATAAQGAALALASQALGVFGLVIFTLPLAVAWYSFKLYMAKSSEVRQRNAELQTVNETLRRTNDQLEESHLSVIGALIGALEAKERLTASHSAHTMTYAIQVAERLGLSAEQKGQIKLAALFHDIGKIGVPENLLRKTSRLDESEWVEVKAHPSIGANLLANIPMLNKIAPIVLAHHERYDGTGYPSGLHADQIPLGAQIIAVADAFEAMTADRPYRKAMPRKAALRELRACAGTQFNPVVVEAFISSVVTDRRRAATSGLEHGLQRVYQQAVEAVRVGI